MTLCRGDGARRRALPTRSSLRHWLVPAASLLCTAGVFIALAATRRQLDLATYWLGGRHAGSGDLYRIVDPVTHLGFTYPPFAAMLFAPVGLLAERVAQLLMTLLNLGALTGLIALGLHLARPELRGAKLAWWSMALVGPVALLDPVRETIYLGQVNLLVVLACLADLTMDLRLPGTRRTLPRGVLVGLTAAVKLTPLVFLPLLLLTSQRRAAMRAFVTFVAAGAGSALVAPGVSRDFWLRAVLDTKRAGSAAWLGNQGVRGVWFRMAHHPVGSGATLVVGIAICSLGVGLGALAYGRIAPIFGVAVCWAAESLGSPISWSHHMVWVVPLILWLAFGRHEVISGARWATALSVLFVAAPIWWAPHSQQQEYAEHGLTLLFTSSFALASFGVLVATAALLVRTSRAAPAVPAVAAAGARPFPGAKAAS